MPSSTSPQGLIIRVHGTGAARPSDDGPAWWQNGSDFHLDLERRLQGVAAAFPKVFHWSGENSERERRAAGERLLEDWLLPLEDHRQPYHLIGHSHGGSVIWAALMEAGRRGRPMEHLKTWTTVGTPFLHYRPEPVDHHLRVISAWLLALLVPVGLLSWQAWGTRYGGSDDYARWVAFLAAPLFLTLLPYALFRAVLHGMAHAAQRAEHALGTNVFALYRGRWNGIHSRYDEAIQGLRGTPALSGEVMIRIPNRIGPIAGRLLAGVLGDPPAAGRAWALFRLAAIVACALLSGLALAIACAAANASLDTSQQLAPVVRASIVLALAIGIVAITCFATAALVRLPARVRDGLRLAGAGLIGVVGLVAYTTDLAKVASWLASEGSLAFFRCLLRVYLPGLGTIAFALLAARLACRPAAACGGRTTEDARDADAPAGAIQTHGAVVEAPAAAPGHHLDRGRAGAADPNDRWPGTPPAVRPLWSDPLLLLLLASAIPASYFLFRFLGHLYLGWTLVVAGLLWEANFLLELLLAAFGLALFGLAPVVFAKRRLGLARREAALFARLVASTLPVAFLFSSTISGRFWPLVWDFWSKIQVIALLIGLAVLVLAPIAYALQLVDAGNARRRRDALREAAAHSDPASWVHAAGLEAEAKGLARFHFRDVMLTPFREVYGAIHNAVLAPVVDEFIWQRLRRRSQGNDRAGMALAAVTEAPVVEAASEPLPEAVDRLILERADEAARLAISRLRTGLGTIAAAGTNVAQVARAIEREEVLTWKELIHNTYFDFDDVRGLLAAPILGNAPAAAVVDRPEPPAEPSPHAGLRQAINVAATIALAAYVPLIVPSLLALGYSALQAAAYYAGFDFWRY